MNNIIKTTLKNAGMKQWELADLLGISEQTLCRKLRYELPEEEQDRLISLIHEYRK